MHCRSLHKLNSKYATRQGDLPLSAAEGSRGVTSTVADFWFHFILRFHSFGRVYARVRCFSAHSGGSASSLCSHSHSRVPPSTVLAAHPSLSLALCVSFEKKKTTGELLLFRFSPVAVVCRFRFQLRFFHPSLLVSRWLHPSQSILHHPQNMSKGFPASALGACVGGGLRFWT